MGALLGIAVGVAIIFTAGGAAVPGALIKGAVIGGAAGGLLGGSSEKSGSGEGGAAGEEPAGEEPAAEEPVDCSEIQSDYAALQGVYAEAQKGLQQAQQNLAAASQGATSTSNNYNVVDQACYSGKPVESPCGQSNTGGCDDLQHQCNNMQALIDSTTQATCQIQTTALKILPGGTASTTANPAANAFTLGITPDTIGVGGTISLVTTISVSNNTLSAIKTFSVAVLDQNGTTLGYLASNVGLSSTLKQVSLQYNFQLPTTMTAGVYTVKIFNDANAAENTTAKLTVSGTGSTSNFSQSSSGAFSNLVLTPSTIYPGGSFLLSSSVNSSSVQSYSVTALKNGQNLGNMGSRISIGTTARPTTVQQTFTTNSSIPVGTYSIQISDDANPSQYLATNLTVASASSFGPSLFTGTSGAAGTYVNANGTSNIATAGTPATGSYGNGNICTLGSSLTVGSRDASTGGQVSALQRYLTNAGFYTYQVTGYYGAITKAAVQKFQASRGIQTVGSVGPLTRASIKSTAPCK